MTRLATLIFTTLLLTGCAIAPGGASDPYASLRANPIPAPDLSWPARWGDGKTHPVTGEPLPKGVIVPLTAELDEYRPALLGSEHHWRPDDEERKQAAALARHRASPLGYRFRMEGPRAFVFTRRASNLTDATEQLEATRLDAGAALAADPSQTDPLDQHIEGTQDPALPNKNDPTLTFAFISAEEQTQASTARPDQVTLQRTWFAYYDPWPSIERGSDKHHGLIVFLPGLYGAPGPLMDDCVQAMRKRGWSVLRTMAPPSHFTLHEEIHIDTADLDAAGKAAADRLGSRVAESAYAVEAALPHVLSERPELRHAPKALLGFSGGALALPAVATRTQGEWDAAVLVAGGADLSMVTERSAYAPWVDALDFIWDNDEDAIPTDDQLAELRDAYLAQAPLDPYHAASALEGVPTLQVHAMFDGAVPAPTGDLLTTRLDNPTRWNEPTVHAGLFFTMSFRHAKIIGWIERAVRDQPTQQPDPVSGN